VSDHISPKQVAQAIGVSESSIKRWCDLGQLAFYKTAGGHRRLKTKDVINFCQANGQQIKLPELLGLPSNTGRQNLGIDRAANLFTKYLRLGDEESLLRILIDLKIAGFSVPKICDQVIAMAFFEIGGLWSKGDIDIFEERLGSSTILKVLARFSEFLAPEAKSQSPIAIGASLEGDHYEVANSLVEICLKSLSWNPKSLGSNLPLHTLEEAIKKIQPHLFWLSVSSNLDDEILQKSLATLSVLCSHHNIYFVVGGRRINSSVQTTLPLNAHYFENMQTMDEWISGLKPT